LRSDAVAITEQAMPELPEVEHNRRNLERWIGGGRIIAARPLDARIVRPLAGPAFARALRRRVVEHVERRGKWIRVALDDGGKLFVHLGMTGWFERVASGAPPLRFERVRFELTRRAAVTGVAYTDPRRWGRIVLAREDLATYRALGPDPLADGIDPRALATKLARRKKSTIKEALLDQRVLAGIGNIQAIEALWKAKIDPRSRAGALAPVDVRALARALHWTIERTLADLAKGDDGAANPFRVYGRKGEPCPRCGATLRWIELAGRTTTFCPGCQRRLH
jgi:formamidopyrimidine-DNA glycosylase